MDCTKTPRSPNFIHHFISFLLYFFVSFFIFPSSSSFTDSLQNNLKEFSAAIYFIKPVQLRFIPFIHPPFVYEGNIYCRVYTIIHSSDHKTFRVFFLPFVIFENVSYLVFLLDTGKEDG